MLVRGGRGAVQLECRLDCQAAEPVHFSVGLFRPTAMARHLAELISMHLERLSIPSAVTAVSIEAVLTGPLDHRQEALFADGPARSRPRLLAVLVDRLSSRLGRRSVLRARLMPEAQPELAYAYDSLIWENTSGRPPRWPKRRKRRHESFSEASLGCQEPARVARSEGRRAWQGPRATHHAHRCTLGVPPDRPLRLLRQPVALAAISVMPDGPPFRFRFHSQEHRIVRSWGPERIETGWWRGRPIARDYYRVETATGQRFWLFRSLDDGRWFLHGNFE
jgi:protein ImuB